jgi:DUF1016 N-terminal domain
MTLPSKSKPSALRSTKKDEATFSEVVRLIAASREKAVQAVNTALIDLYSKIGETISHKIEAAEWGDGVVEQLANFIAITQPGLRGFTRRNLFRMRQFYEAYRDKSNCVAAGDTIAVDALPHHPGTEQARGRARILLAPRYPGGAEQA